MTHFESLQVKAIELVKVVWLLLVVGVSQDEMSLNYRPGDGFAFWYL